MQRAFSRLGYAGLAMASALTLAMPSAPALAAGPARAPGASPAQCSPGDAPEPGVQGDVPAGLEDWKFNCGVRLVGELPLVGNVQGSGSCAYVRTRDVVHVIDVRNPRKPVEVGTIPVKYASETMRAVTTGDRAVLVSGSSVYDIANCLKPQLKGEIAWPPLSVGVSPPNGGGGGTGLLPHDLRISPDGTKVYGSLGLWEVDISNLDDPATWSIADLRCEVLSQVPGTWQEVHRKTLEIGMSLCDDVANPEGANWRLGGSNLQTAVLWGQLSHGIGVSGDGTRVFVGDQAGGSIGRLTDGQPMVRVVDVSARPVTVLGETTGPGHSIDWFTNGRGEYLVHANEVGTSAGDMLRKAMAAQGADGERARRISAMASAAVNMMSDTCTPVPRSTALGWAFDAVVTDVSDPASPANVGRLAIAINEPEHCEARKASGRDPSVAYHMVDDPADAHFAAVNFGSAGLRFFDIRDPANPVEVAYFNHGPMVHGGVGYYDTKRNLMYAAGEGGFRVLELAPQVKRRLGL